MRLGFDATSLTRDGKGLARFQSEFLHALGELGLVEELTVFVSEDADERLLPRVAGWRYRRVRARPMVVWEQLGLPRWARRERLDAVVTTSERSALWGPARVVYLFEHPRHRLRRDRETGARLRQQAVNASTRALFELSVRSAAAVLAASQATASELPRRGEVRVVYPGASAEFSPDPARGEAARARLGAPSGYFLHLASDDPRDNTETVVAALARLAGLGERPPLVIAGPLRRSLGQLRRRAEDLGVSAQVRWIGFQRGEALADLYRGAVAYVDPSLYEGFGLQALEAMACGTPAIASNRTSLPEVVGDGGVLLDPHDARGFAEAMRTLVRDAERRAELGRRACRRAASFTWERTVRDTLAACTHVVGAASGHAGRASARGRTRGARGPRAAPERSGTPARRAPRRAG